MSAPRVAWLALAVSIGTCVWTAYIKDDADHAERRAFHAWDEAVNADERRRDLQQEVEALRARVSELEARRGRDRR